MNRKLPIALRLLGWLLFVAAFVTPLSLSRTLSGTLKLWGGLQLFLEAIVGGLICSLLGIVQILGGQTHGEPALFAIFLLTCAVWPNLSVLFWRLSAPSRMIATILPWTFLLTSPAIRGGDMYVGFSNGLPDSTLSCLPFYPWAIGIGLIHTAALIGQFRRDDPPPAESQQLFESRGS